MSTPNPILVAASPALIAILQAVQTFNTNIGADPTKWALTVPGAFQILLGSIQLQLPGIAVAEGTLVQTEINTKVGSWITALQAAQASAAKPT